MTVRQWFSFPSKPPWDVKRITEDGNDDQITNKVTRKQTLNKWNGTVPEFHNNTIENIHHWGDVEQMELHRLLRQTLWEHITSSSNVTEIIFTNITNKKVIFFFYFEKQYTQLLLSLITLPNVYEYYEY